MNVKEAMLVAAVFRAGQVAPKSMAPASRGGEVDIAMSAIGIGYRERAIAVLGEHVGTDAVFVAIEELAKDLGIPLHALRPGEDPKPWTRPFKPEPPA